MKEYIQFCKQKGLRPCLVSSVEAFDKARNFNPIESVREKLLKKSMRERGGVYVDVRS